MIDWLGPVIVEYYAATEGGGTLITAQEWLRKPGSVGLPWPARRSGCWTEAGQPVPPGQQGLVYMRMGTLTFSYHQDEEKTQAARAGDLFTVGDIGYTDEDGYLFLCDRGSDVIISGGVNIYPAEVESELSCHPAVADVAVFGIPHERVGGGGQGGRRAGRRGHARPGAHRGSAGVPGRAGGEVQAAADHRLRRGTAPRPERQALQAAAARPLLGRPRPRDLTLVPDRGGRRVAPKQ